MKQEATCKINDFGGGSSLESNIILIRMVIGLLILAVITLAFSGIYIIFQYEWLRQLGINLMYVWIGIGIFVMYMLVIINTNKQNNYTSRGI